MTGLELLSRLQELYQDALDVYESNGRTDYDAGVVEGLKRAIEILTGGPR